MANLPDFGNMSLTDFISSQEACVMQYLIAATAHTVHPDNEGKCPVMFDFVLCWPETAANTTVQLECPSFVSGIRYYTMRNVTRQCFSNQTWSAKADYSGCVLYDDINDIPMFHLKIMYYMYWVGYAVSLVFLLFALGIFLHYKNLWCLRNIIHTNLVLCFTLHNLTWICYSFFAHELQLSSSNEADELNLCIIPTTLLKYFIAAGFFWMFVEGFYLFVNVMFSFHAQRIRFWMCCIVGWGVPFVLIIITSIAKNAKLAQNCWDEQQHYLDYIFIGPVLLLLSVNLIFLFLIMYVVMAKLQLTVHAELERYKKGVKALLILCPLLGINYVLVLASPSRPSWLKLTFSYYCVLISSTQGLLVALFFCFRNNEVREFVSKSYARMRRRLRVSRNVSMATRSSHSDIVSTNATTEGRAELLVTPISSSANGYSARTSPKISTTSLPGRSGWLATKPPTRQKCTYQNVIMIDHTGRLYSASRGHGLFQSNPALAPYRSAAIPSRPTSARKTSHSESEGVPMNTQTTM